MIASKVNSVLEKHPYYASLSSADKLSVLNIALINYWNFKDDEITHGVIPNDEIGWDDIAIDNDEIYKLAQSDLGVENLSTYRSIDINLSGTEYLKDFTEADRMIIYTLAVQKISKRITDYYDIQNITASLDYSINATMPELVTGYYNPMVYFNGEPYFSAIATLINKVVYTMPKFYDIIADLLTKVKHYFLIKSDNEGILGISTSYSTNMNKDMKVLFPDLVVSFSTLGTYSAIPTLACDVAYVTNTAIEEDASATMPDIIVTFTT